MQRTGSGQLRLSEENAIPIHRFNAITGSMASDPLKTDLRGESREFVGGSLVGHLEDNKIETMAY
jgi:hypothetical protein